jgi:hypothetical protein
MHAWRSRALQLRPDEEERIHAIVERSAILDTSKFVRIAVDSLLRSDIGQVIKTILDDEAFPDYALPKRASQPAHEKTLTVQMAHRRPAQCRI